jgi:hypothetical protein
MVRHVARIDEKQTQIFGRKNSRDKTTNAVWEDSIKIVPNDGVR